MHLRYNGNNNNNHLIHVCAWMCVCVCRLKEPSCLTSDRKKNYEKRREEKKRTQIESQIKKTSTALPFSMTEVGYRIS